MEHHWEFGIFTIISVIIILGIVVTSRFMYLDNRYNGIIREFGMRLADLNNEDDSDPKVQKVVLRKHEVLVKQIAEYRTHRNENRSVGIKIDLLSIGMILLLGFLTVFGVFENTLVSLSIFLSGTFAMPLAYLVYHIRIANRITAV